MYLWKLLCKSAAGVQRCKIDGRYLRKYMTKILVGCDPEVFVKKAGVFHSAHGLIKGDKANPQKVRRGAVQVDGMALEFNIDPAATEDEFVINVNDVLGQMAKMVPGYEIVISPVAHFTLEHMKAQPREALELGCEPDFNAWTGGINTRPNGDRPMRTAAGHVHIGWTQDQSIEDPGHRHNCNLIAKEMDFRLGLASLEYDSDIERRSMYGCGGAVRYKPYGVEYRTLSCKWLDSENLQRWVYRNVIKGVEFVMAGGSLADKYGDIQKIINTSDVKAARAIIAAENLEVCYG
jgi:hypothetical protein